MDTSVCGDISSFLVQTMKISSLVIRCIPLFGSLGCYSLSMADISEEEDELLLHKGISTEEETNLMTTVALHQEQYSDGKIILEKIMEPFGVGVSF